MKQAEQYPDALCVVDGDGEHSYQDMMQDAKAMACVWKPCPRFL